MDVDTRIKGETLLNLPPSDQSENYWLGHQPIINKNLWALPRSKFSKTLNQPTNPPTKLQIQRTLRLSK